jgi:hypothetical protein
MATIRATPQARSQPMSGALSKGPFRLWVARKLGFPMRSMPLALASAVALVAGVALLSQRNPLHSQGASPAEETRSSVASRSDGFRSRAVGINEDDAAVSISIYRQDGPGHRSVVDQVATDDYLAFAYTNSSKAELRYLILFGVDERGDIYWYYPAHEKRDENPCSISVRQTHEETPLPDEVQHHLLPGQLKIWALFSKTPLCVSSIEQLLKETFTKARSLSAIRRLDLPETTQHTSELSVRTRRAPPNTGVEDSGRSSH